MGPWGSGWGIGRMAENTWGALLLYCSCEGKGPWANSCEGRAQSMSEIRKCRPRIPPTFYNTETWETFPSKYYSQSDISHFAWPPKIHYLTLLFVQYVSSSADVFYKLNKSTFFTFIYRCIQPSNDYVLLCLSWLICISFNSFRCKCGVTVSISLEKGAILYCQARVLCDLSSTATAGRYSASQCASEVAAKLR